MFLKFYDFNTSLKTLLKEFYYDCFVIFVGD